MDVELADGKAARGAGRWTCGGREERKNRSRVGAWADERQNW